MATEISLNMNTLFALLRNTEILTNCNIAFNKAGNITITIQEFDNTSLYTIGSLRENPSKFWIRGCRCYNN